MAWTTIRKNEIRKIEIILCIILNHILKRLQVNTNPFCATLFQFLRKRKSVLLEIYEKVISMKRLDEKARND